MTEQQKSSLAPYLLFSIALLVVIIGVYWWVNSSDVPNSDPVNEVIPVATVPANEQQPQPEPEETTPVEIVTAEPTPIAPPSVPTPEPVALNESDAPFRSEVANLAPAHAVADWLTPNQIIRKFAAMIDGASRGELLFKNRPVVGGVEGSFISDDTTGEIVLSAENYARYDTLISAFEYVNEADAVELYRFWSPRLEQAYGELGIEGSFHSALITAIDNLLAAPSVEGKIVLVRPSVYFQFADPELEARSDLEKFIIRIGPANAERLKAKLRSLRDALI